MSISIKNITVAIDGTPSQGFELELQGIPYHMNNFTLIENLMKPSALSFSMHRGPEEHIQDVQFQVCGEIIGKDITLTLETENIEQESLGSGGEKTADITFSGVITSASGSRSGSEFYINVEAHSHDVLLDDNLTCKSFEKMCLDDIIADVLNDYNGELTSNVVSRFTEEIPYCVQYNETNYQFLQRLAMRYGEWMYHDGTQFVFGNLVEREQVVLTYPGQDISNYQVNMRVEHVAFQHVASSYNSFDAEQREGLPEMQKSYNTLSDKAFAASQERFTKATLQNLHSGGYADSDGRQTILDVSTKTQARGEKAGMLTYSGDTYSSRLHIGSILVVRDNYLTDYSNASRSDVEQDEILIIGVVHTFDDQRVYSNSFTGIPSKCDWPPYYQSDVYPVSPSCRARVTDNEDPNALGRVRVQFDWQAQQDGDMQTPWLRIAQPYAGGGKGFSFIPEIGEEVMVDFEGGNAERPYVSGTLYNGPCNPDDAWLPGDNQVKAIRTRSGHTVEIWDQGQGGYIRIYDHGKENYILTFSTDEKLIKLESTGNIELYAKNDIIMQAGHDINASADNDIFIAASHDMQRTADNDIREHAGHDRTTSIDRNDSLTVSENQFIKVDDNKDEQVKHKLQVTAENIRAEAQQKLMEYSTTHHAKAQNDMALNAGTKIDVKAAIVKVN